MSSHSVQRDIDMRMMSHAARIALRGHGGAEPNPMVGCVIATPAGEVISEGYHRRCGEAHAEVHALAAAGGRARGATAYVTLEPCAHHGRTPPCADALVRAGVARVVFARPDPNVAAQGGRDVLARAGIATERIPHEGAASLTEGFARRVLERMPWVIAKWAATADNRCAADPAHGRWISSMRSRQMVQRERARVDAVITAIGTVRADDPHLMPRVSRPRRVPRRVVIDPRLQVPLHAQLIRTSSEGPVEIACAPAARAERPAQDIRAMEHAGIRWRDVDAAAPRGELLRSLLSALSGDGISTVLTEAGPGLVRALLDADLVDEAWIFTSTSVRGDPSSAHWPTIDTSRFALRDERRRDSDFARLWRRAR
jgi:diaminohydroxyphosphoribosylaminopyrimidine deaminase/5-amino-6-(5-phosphoribosylamino)uracil reductase